jgi:hypothetical protein
MLSLRLAVAFSLGGDGVRRSPELLAQTLTRRFSAAIVIVVTIKLASRPAAFKVGRRKEPP